MSLTWNFTLTADELTKSNTYFLIKWSKFNPSSSSYDQIAFRIKTVGLPPGYTEDAPHIVVDRATGVNSATLHINDIRIDNVGTYKIEISIEFPGTATVADHEVNLTVLGTFNVKGVLTLTHSLRQGSNKLNCSQEGSHNTIKFTLIRNIEIPRGGFKVRVHINIVLVVAGSRGTRRLQTPL